MWYNLRGQSVFPIYLQDANISSYAGFYPSFFNFHHTSQFDIINWKKKLLKPANISDISLKNGLINIWLSSIGLTHVSGFTRLRDIQTIEDSYSKWQTDTSDSLWTFSLMSDGLPISSQVHIEIHWSVSSACFWTLGSKLWALPCFSPPQTTGWRCGRVLRGSVILQTGVATQ